MSRIKSNYPILGIGVAILAITAAPALGQGMMQERMSQRFATMDENGDGVMSSAEHEMHTGDMFAAMDADDSNTLTKEEFMSLSMGPGPQGSGPMAAKRQNMMKAKKASKFSAMDVDKNGVVTKAEFDAFSTAKFNSADTNSDGSIDLSEFLNKHAKP